MDDLIEAIFKGAERPSRNNDEILKELQTIRSMLQELLRGDRARNFDELCSELMGKAYVITRSDPTKTRPMLVAIPLSENRFLVTHKDTLEALKAYFELYRSEEELESRLPPHLRQLFLWMKREGIIYYDATTKKYEFV
ncbi:MAG: hypothetical protein ACP5HQ_05285 [Thermoprotei archaeon]